MIIRILGEDQYEVADAELDRLNVLDERVQQAVEAGDEGAFSAGLARLLDAVRERGARLPDSSLTASDLVLPGTDSTLEEVADLVGDEGLIPG